MQRRGRTTQWILPALAVGLLACGGTPAPPAPVLPDDAGAAVLALEERLVSAPEVRFESSATAEGVVTADLSGLVALGPGTVEIRQSGTFVDNPADLDLRVEAGRLLGGNGDHRFEREVPVDLRRAMVLGLTRMGILHNLARLSGAMPPDHGDGGIETWLTIDRPAWGETAEAEGVPSRALDFGLLVEGEHAADVRLWLDEATGLPVRREQLVRFPQGEMRVVERYRGWAVADGR